MSKDERKDPRAIIYATETSSIGVDVVYLTDFEPQRESVPISLLKRGLFYPIDYVSLTKELVLGSPHDGPEEGEKFDLLIYKQIEEIDPGILLIIISLSYERPALEITLPLELESDLDKADWLRWQAHRLLHLNQIISYFYPWKAHLLYDMGIFHLLSPSTADFRIEKEKTMFIFSHAINFMTQYLDNEANDKGLYIKAVLKADASLETIFFYNNEANEDLMFKKDSQGSIRVHNSL